MPKNSPAILAALLLALATAASAAPAPEPAPLPASAVPGAPPAAPAAKESDGAVRSVMASTHITFGKLGIGALATDIGPYLDENEVRKDGLHARLSISIAKDPAAHQEVSLVVGQTIMTAGYRIKVEAISPGDRGSVSLRLWAPPQAPKLSKKWPLNLFGKD